MFALAPDNHSQTLSTYTDKYGLQLNVRILYVGAVFTNWLPPSMQAATRHL